MGHRRQLRNCVSFYLLQADVSKQPQLKTPSGDKVLANELSGAASKETLHWFALSNNDSYLMSVSGGSVSLYNAFLQKVNPIFY